MSKLSSFKAGLDLFLINSQRELSLEEQKDLLEYTNNELEIRICEIEEFERVEVIVDEDLNLNDMENARWIK